MTAKAVLLQEGLQARRDALVRGGKTATAGRQQQEDGQGM